MDGLGFFRYGIRQASIMSSSVLVFYLFIFLIPVFFFFLVGLSPFYLKFCLVNNSEETGDIHVTMIVITNYTRVVVVVVVLLSEQGDAY